MDSEFDNLIEYDSGSSDKENEEKLNPIRQPKTTKEQFDRIATFTNENDGKQMDKKTYESLWDNLAAQLNDIGPPDHTTSEWKRIWSVHKYNKKRKQLADSDSEETASFVHSDGPSCSATNAAHEVTEKLDFMSQQSEVSKKIDVVIEKQKEMIANQMVIIRLLKEITKKK